jgi:hypothetical protein
VSRTLDIDVYYTGIEGRARVSSMGAEEQILPLARGRRLHLPVTAPAGGMFWATLR